MFEAKCLDEFGVIDRRSFLCNVVLASEVVIERPFVFDGESVFEHFYYSLLLVLVIWGMR